MWRSVVLVCLVGCSFHPHALTEDASPLGSDARPDAPSDAAMLTVDAPADACVDSDADGICDAVDTWPCGAAPTPPGAAVVMTGNGGQTSITLTTISAGGSQMLVVAPGASYQVSFHYDITDTACSVACRDQIEIGYVPGNRLKCMFDATVSEATGASGNTSTNLAAPTTPGSYDLRANIGQNNSCGTTTQWWSSQPDDTRTLARLCVH